jgi:hypothetical protein
LRNWVFDSLSGDVIVEHIHVLDVRTGTLKRIR